MTGSVETYQLSVEAAEVYESSFVPALFAGWAAHLVEAAGIAPGQAVLDVARGTGIVARTAADRMGGPRGHGRRPGVGPPGGPGGLRGRVRGVRGAPGPGGDAAGELLLVAGRSRPAGVPVRGRRLRVTGTRTRASTVHFGSAEEAVATEIAATPLAQRIGQDTYRRLLEAASEAMRPFQVDGGRVELPIQGHVVTGVRAG